MKEVNCFGYNSGRFDLPCLMPFIGSWSLRHGIKLQALKRCNTYITIQLGDIIFKGKPPALDSLTLSRQLIL